MESPDQPEKDLYQTQGPRDVATGTEAATSAMSLVSFSGIAKPSHENVRAHQTLVTLASVGRLRCPQARLKIVMQHVGSKTVTAVKL